MTVPAQFINEKWVFGGAAQNVLIKRLGGFKNHAERLVKIQTDAARIQVPCPAKLIPYNPPKR